jgi:hypothetical protein
METVCAVSGFYDPPETCGNCSKAYSRAVCAAKLCSALLCRTCWFMHRDFHMLAQDVMVEGYESSMLEAWEVHRKTEQSGFPTSQRMRNKKKTTKRKQNRKAPIY